METTLNIRDPEIVGGREIDVVSINIRNPRLHRSLEQLSRLVLYCLECPSNNTGALAIPSDVQVIREQFDLARESFDFHTAEENNDLPATNYEYAYQVLMVHQQEIQRITNPKMREIVQELWDCQNILLGLDSANTPGFVSPDQKAKVLKWFDFVTRDMDRIIGKGTNLGDTGRHYPSLELLGKIRPSLTMDYAEMLEPTKDMPKAAFPDVPDAASESKKK